MIRTRQKTRRIRTRRTRPGMTLVEMLTAIGVIALLISMLVIGINFVSARAKQDKTRTLLQNLRSMLTEFEVKGGRKQVIDQPFGNPPANGWHFIRPITLPGPAGEKGVNLIGDPEKWDDDQVNFLATAGVVNAIRGIPSNKTIFDNLPPEMVVKVRVPRDPDDASRPRNYVLMPTDAWGNPILYAPRRAAPWPAEGATPLPKDRPEEKNWQWGATGLESAGGTRDVKPTDGKGLWISAGPDGNYNTHDDNLYSSDALQ